MKTPFSCRISFHFIHFTLPHKSAGMNVVTVEEITRAGGQWADAVYEWYENDQGGLIVLQNRLRDLMKSLEESAPAGQMSSWGSMTRVIDNNKKIVMSPLFAKGLLKVLTCKQRLTPVVYSNFWKTLLGQSVSSKEAG